VNGEPIQSFNHPINPESDQVTINGKYIRTQSKAMTYLMLNKPQGIVSSTKDDRNRTTVLDIIPNKYRDLRLYPVGRLDKDSTGLIILTNDGELTNRLTHPRYEKEKEYLLQIEVTLKPEDRKKLEQGIELEEGVTHEANVRAVNIPPYNYSIIIHEGKKRQIRRMFINLGYRVLELKRIRIGSLRLGTLPEGQIRELTHAELKALKK
jgi:23S rRNA pseudouridine2605 synthase